MTRPLLKNYAYLFLITASAVFSFYINSFSQTLNRDSIIIQYASLNSWFFYSFNDVFFMDFSFQNIHPYYVFGSLIIKTMSAEAALLFFFIAFAGLVYGLLSYEKFNYYDLILWTISLPFLFLFQATLFLVWIQYLSLRILQKKTLLWSSLPLFIGKVVFYLIMSLVFLPGVFLIFIIELTESFSHEWEFASVLPLLYSGGIAFLLMVGFQILLADKYFVVSREKWMSYLALPFQAYQIKSKVNNLVPGDAFLSHIEVYKNLYMVIPYGVVLAILREDLKGLLLRICLTVGLLLVGVFITQGTPTFYVFCAYFILIISSKPMTATVQKKLLIFAGSIFLLFFYVIGMPPHTRKSVEIQDENVIISYKDFIDANFYGKNLKDVKIVDLKIIPVNVEQLLSDIRSGKIEDFLNPYIMLYLDRELLYGRSLIAGLKEQKYTIYLKSAIHPEGEPPPYRRVFEIWNKLKETDSKIILY